MMVSPVVFVTMISMTEAANGKTFHSSPHQTDCELGRFVPHQEPMKREEHSVIVFCFYPFFGRKYFQRNLRHGSPLDSYLKWLDSRQMTKGRCSKDEESQCVEWKWTWRNMTTREVSLTNRIFGLWNFLSGMFLSELTRVVKGSKPDVADFFSSNLQPTTREAHK